jgi:hypothetical protein
MWRRRYEEVSLFPESEQQFSDSQSRRSRFVSGLIAFIAAGSSLAAPVAANQAAKPDGQVGAGPDAAAVFKQQVDQLRVARCANLFSAFGNAVTAGSTFSVQAQADPKAPDAHMVQGVVGMTYNRPDYSGQAAGIVLASPVGQTCEGQMVRVAPFQRACKDVVGLLPKGSIAAGNLSGVPLYNLGGNQGQAMLVPSGAACVVVTVTRAAAVR